MRAAVRATAMGVAVLSPVASHIALGLGRGYGAAMALAGLQAVALGVVLWAGGGRGRWAGAGLAAALLGALALGARSGAAAGLLAAAGLSHAVLYAALLVVFGRTLAPGREALVTYFARRLNPRFRAGMVPYTRGVTWAWCGMFAGQIVASALLLALAPKWWPGFVTTLHVPVVVGFALGEFGLRAWWWRREHFTGLRDTVSGVRAIGREMRAGGRTSGPGANCR